VRNCNICQRSKASSQKTHGWPKPLKVPQHPWKDVSIDLVVGLPESGGCNAIRVIVDQLSKIKHLILCRGSMDGKIQGEMFQHEVCRLQGSPDTIVSDRGSQFTSEVWRHICKRLEIEQKSSTAFHPQID
jgi:hypothetical protein